MKIEKRDEETWILNKDAILEKSGLSIALNYGIEIQEWKLHLQTNKKKAFKQLAKKLREYASLLEDLK